MDGDRPDPVEREIQRTFEGKYSLTPDELWWRQQSDLLLERGYSVRSRYRTGWTPSWLGTDRNPRDCEDCIRLIHHRILDAVRISDGLSVVIKKTNVVYSTSPEIKMLLRLNTPELRSDPRNPSVPILDHFPSTDDDIVLLVIPYLCAFYIPQFSFADEVIDFFQQTLEGLDFFHENFFIHRDLGFANIMMAGEQLYPEGHHLGIQMFDTNARGPAKTLRRRDVAKTNPVRYYFIDFESVVERDPRNGSTLIYGQWGQDDDLPELRYDGWYQPFPVDVFMLGNVYKKELVKKYENLAFLTPLVLSMTRNDPAERPTAQEALKTFNLLVKSQSWFNRRRRLRRYGETRSETFIRDAISFLREEVMLRFSRWKYALAIIFVTPLVLDRVSNYLRFNPSSQLRVLIRRSMHA